MDAPLIYLLKEFVVVAIVNVNSDDHRARCVERLLQYRGDLVRRLNHETMCSERFCIFNRIDRAELYAGRPSILLFRLNTNHVICPVGPDHVYEIRLEPYRCFEFHCRKEKTTIA